MIVSRLFAVIAAVALVTAFALASLLPPDMPLGQVGVAMAPEALRHLRLVTLHDAPARYSFRYMVTISC